MCAVAFHQFTTRCASTIELVLPAMDPMRADLARFEELCFDSAEGNDQFMQAIMGAHCPEEDEIIILREDGAAANPLDRVDPIYSWSDGEVTDVGSAGRVHGPWGNDVTDVSIVLDIPDGIIQCQVSWRSWAIDSRDGEIDRVIIDDAEVWSQAARCGDSWELGPVDFPNPYGGRACFAIVEVEVPCTETLTLHFSSGIDQAENDEAWAFSDVSVIGSTGTVVILRESGASSTGWSNDVVTDAGSAGTVHGPW